MSQMPAAHFKTNELAAEKPEIQQYPIDPVITQNLLGVGRC